MSQGQHFTKRVDGIRAVGLLSGWKLRNMFRTLLSDPRKLIPVIFIVISLGGALFAVTTLKSLSGQNQNSQQEMLKSLRDIKAYKKAHSSDARDPAAGIDTQLMASMDTSIDPVLFSSCLSVIMIVLGLMLVNSGLGEGLLAFAPPDVDYLFPSPVSRRVVIAYRLPGLTIGALATAVYLIFMLNMVSALGQLKMPNSGNVFSPWWTPFLAMFFFGGTYLNLAMFIAIRFQHRKLIRKALIAAILILASTIGILIWKVGVEALEPLLQSNWVRWLFFPSTLASETLIDTYSHVSAGQPLEWLFAAYLLSMIPMFATNANWYEQSIVVSERMSALREAAKGGMSGVMAARAAASFSDKHLKEYAVPPFGNGAAALFWAHLCAAAKKPIPNFVLPLVAGIVAGIISSSDFLTPSVAHSHRRVSPAVHQSLEAVRYTIFFVVIFYGSMIFSTIARNAAEAAIRRRELIAPLPIKGWQVVAADMGVSVCAMLLFYLALAATYGVMRGPEWQMVLVGVGIGLPIRSAGRFVLQYIVVIAYPDLADKIQRLVSPMIYGLVALPFLLVEGLAILPGAILQSPWGVLIPLILVQIPLLAFFLFLAGKASQRAIATGEPVRLTRLFRPNL